MSGKAAKMVRSVSVDKVQAHIAKDIAFEQDAQKIGVQSLIDEENHDVSTWVRCYLDLRQFKEMLAERCKVQEELVRQLVEEHLPRVFDKAGVKTITLDDGRRITLSALVRASIKDKEAAYAWLRANGGEDLIQPTVNASTLAAFAKERAQEGNDLPDEIFNVYFMPSVSVTKTK